MICHSCEKKSKNNTACSHCGITMQQNYLPAIDDKYVFVPLGTRCSAAYVVRDQLKKRHFSLPFDWIGMPGIAPMTKFIGLDLPGVDEFMFNYFEKVSIASQRHPDEMWYVHDIVGITPDNGAEVMREVRERYARRFKRFIELLLSGKSLVFISVMAVADYDDPVQFDKLKQAIRERATGECFFITINLVKTHFVKHDHVNFYIPINESAPMDERFYKLECEVAEVIKKNSITQKYFE